MKSKSLLQIIPAILLSASLAAVAADKPKASPSPAAAAAAGTKRTVTPEAASKMMLTRLTNEVGGLTAAEQTKAKPIIDKYVADRFAVRDDATLDSAAKQAKSHQLKQQYDTDIGAILTPAKQKKYAAAEEARTARMQAGREKKAAVGAAAPSPTPKAGQ